MSTKKQTEAKRKNRSSKKLQDLHGKVGNHEAQSVRGGKTKNTDPKNYLEIKMNDVIVTS